MQILFNLVKVMHGFINQPHAALDSSAMLFVSQEDPGLFKSISKKNNT